MAPTLEVGCQEALDDRIRVGGAEPLAGEREHVGVVVAAAHLGLVGIVRVDRTDPSTLLATIETPTPEPQTMTARSASPSPTSRAAAAAKSG